MNTRTRTVGGRTVGVVCRMKCEHFSADSNTCTSVTPRREKPAVGVYPNLFAHTHITHTQQPHTHGRLRPAARCLAACLNFADFRVQWPRSSPRLQPAEYLLLCLPVRALTCFRCRGNGHHQKRFQSGACVEASQHQHQHQHQPGARSEPRSYFTPPQDYVNKGEEKEETSLAKNKRRSSG